MTPIYRVFVIPGISQIRIYAIQPETVLTVVVPVTGNRYITKVATTTCVVKGPGAL